MEFIVDLTLLVLILILLSSIGSLLDVPNPYVPKSNGVHDLSLSIREYIYI